MSERLPRCTDQEGLIASYQSYAPAYCPERAAAHARKTVADEGREDQGLVEAVARAITNDLSRQDGYDEEWQFESDMPGLVLTFLDQGFPDMAQVARAAIRAFREYGEG